ncbi:MAG: HNH endonuclease [FCB group bacterium]|nr:HNH endonuclease [FCB group bacterium]
MNSLLNRRVLVLNQNYQPISIAPTKRAIILLFLEKVEVLEHYREFINSPSLSLQLPSVVKLKNYTSFRFRDIGFTRKNILKRDHYTCQYCGKTNVPMTLDHIIPRRRGGKETWENIVTACMPCNEKKGFRTPRESNMKLLRIPKKPTRITFFQQHVKKHQQAWKQYLFMDRK